VLDPEPTTPTEIAKDVSMTKVALTGARGQLGKVLRTELLRRGVNLRSAGGSQPLTPLVEGEDVCYGDLRDPAVVDRVLDGADTVIHLAGTSVERPLSEIIENNLKALYELYEGARRHRVKRVVFASSNHAFGMYSIDDKLDPGPEYRPDCFYGLSKVWGEAMTRMYWDKHGVEGISLRIGSCLPRPTQFRHLSTWLGHEDFFHMITQCLEVPDVGCLAVWGISNNTRRYWTFGENEERLGYKPKQDAEIYAAEILKQENTLDEFAQRYQGGGFATIDFTPPQMRPPRRAKSGS
jgi:uronate dehydrogenase